MTLNSTNKRPTIGDVFVNKDLSLIIDLDPPVEKEHRHLIVKLDNPNYNYYYIQAGSPKPNSRSRLMKVYGDVVMQDDLSLKVDRYGSGDSALSDVRNISVVKPNDGEYNKIILRVGDMQPGDVRPLIMDC